LQLSLVGLRLDIAMESESASEDALGREAKAVRVLQTPITEAEADTRGGGGGGDEASSDGEPPPPGEDLDRGDSIMLSGGDGDGYEDGDGDGYEEGYEEGMEHGDEDAPPCPEEEEEEGGDEWVDDSDMGYLLEPISEGEFLEIEERFSKIFSVYREDNALSPSGSRSQGGGDESPDRLVDSLRLDDDELLQGGGEGEGDVSQISLPLSVLSLQSAGERAAQGQAQAQPSSSPAGQGHAAAEGETKKQRKNRNRNKKKQSDGPPAAKGAAAAAEEGDGSVGYEGMDLDLDAVALDFQVTEANPNQLTGAAGKRRRRKNKAKNRRRQSVADGGEAEAEPPSGVPPSAPGGDAPLDEKVASSPAPHPSTPASKNNSAKKKGGRNSGKQAPAGAAGAGAGAEDAPPADSLGLSPAAAAASPAVQERTPGGSHRKRNRKRGSAGGASAAASPSPGDELKTPEAADKNSKPKSGSGKKNKSSNKKKNSSEVKATPTPDELAAGTFHSPSALLGRSGGSVGNVGFSAGEVSPDHDHHERHVRSDVRGQKKYKGVDGDHYYFDLKVIFEPFRTGFEEEKHFNPPTGAIIVGRYEICETLGQVCVLAVTRLLLAFMLCSVCSVLFHVGYIVCLSDCGVVLAIATLPQAAFSTAYQCLDLEAGPDDHPWVCLKVSTEAAVSRLCCCWAN
jgi:hypothetical protein